jgi:hypothetical protein
VRKAQVNPLSFARGAFNAVLIRMNIEGNDLNALAVEAFNDLLKKHGKKQTVGNPLAD